ncbi:hypothetical protein KS4_34140 [Poriferisphaera corsica]|uniref:Uncharacterized protein n=1 Tax=Poriferisphaera corsica TaxID=2528020 RepID=A0A517YYN3_9BACT|nr:hypothetical protein [Poriferisphaera corsica]QDU35333.1 hypothetical protein KS4_34140 [Poriferisphaera corsica]
MLGEDDFRGSACPRLGWVRVFGYRWSLAMRAVGHLLIEGDLAMIFRPGEGIHDPLS